MSKIFLKDRIVPQHIIDDIQWETKNMPGKQSSTTKGTLKRDRSSVSKHLIPPTYADLCEILEYFCSRFDSTKLPSTLMLKEFEHLQYGPTDHFVKHTDDIKKNNPKRIRRFTTVTLLSKTKDLEGGDLLVFDKDMSEININLDVGETVVFYSSTLHQVTPIIKGGREVLVGWIYDR